MGSSSSVNNFTFHEACRKGDVESVRKLLPTMKYKKINCRGLDGNTPLHLACESNHKEIVSLLFDERDLCSRTILNNKRLTAYESTKSDEIRQLFRRPTTSGDQRFYDNNVTSSLQPIPSTTNLTHQSSIPIPDDWLRGHTNAENAVDGQFMLALTQAPWFIKKFLKIRTERECQEYVELLLEKCITKNLSQREKIMEEYNKYKRTKCIYSLLTIYTMNTPIYGALQTETSAYATILFLHLNELINRTFIGQTYRGASMTQNAIEAYKWAQSSKDYILETRTFQSTSKLRAVAEMFSESEVESNQISVIITYIFKEKCSTAIDLGELSNFPEECEVLLFPFTTFRVESITIDSANGFCNISLLYIPSTQKSFISSWLHVKA
ncbi:unnamed protein product [Rotaria sp. Silwood2]|nr:unnamed protein product [Rotaria sp. Silwood2]